MFSCTRRSVQQREVSTVNGATVMHCPRPTVAAWLRPAVAAQDPLVPPLDALTAGRTHYSSRHCCVVPPPDAAAMGMTHIAQGVTVVVPSTILSSPDCERVQRRKSSVPHATAHAFQLVTLAPFLVDAHLLWSCQRKLSTVARQVRIPLPLIAQVYPAHAHDLSSACLYSDGLHF